MFDRLNAASLSAPSNDFYSSDQPPIKIGLDQHNEIGSKRHNLHLTSKLMPSDNNVDVKPASVTLPSADPTDQATRCKVPEGNQHPITHSKSSSSDDYEGMSTQGTLIAPNESLKSDSNTAPMSGDMSPSSPSLTPYIIAAAIRDSTIDKNIDPIDPPTPSATSHVHGTESYVSPQPLSDANFFNQPPDLGKSPPVLTAFGTNLDLTCLACGDVFESPSRLLSCITPSCGR